jgi:hypothetical protein
MHPFSDKVLLWSAGLTSRPVDPGWRPLVAMGGNHGADLFDLFPVSTGNIALIRNFAATRLLLSSLVDMFSGRPSVVGQQES